VAQFEFIFLRVILSLRRIWRAADMHLGANSGGARKILQDEAELVDLRN
jgi:hypothetical protein